jgi:hypothetical protein
MVEGAANALRCAVDVLDLQPDDLAGAKTTTIAEMSHWKKRTVARCCAKR